MEAKKGPQIVCSSGRGCQPTEVSNRKQGFSASHTKVPPSVLGDAKVNILTCLTTRSETEGLTHLVVGNAANARNRTRPVLLFPWFNYEPKG